MNESKARTLPKSQYHRWGITCLSCLRGILKGLAKRRFMNTLGIRSWLTRELARKASNLFRKLVDIKLSGELN